MRGAFVDQGGLFSYIAPEARVPGKGIRELVRDVLGELSRSLGRLYASEGRPSIPPEQLLSALLLQVFYGIRSERQLMEQTFRHFLLIAGYFKSACNINVFRIFSGMPEQSFRKVLQSVLRPKMLKRSRQSPFLVPLFSCRMVALMAALRST